ncbi:ribosomal protein S18-alanine N-acetyltransferase [Gephyromycinifex aptenodytis]|uniref:ribosomal protein S18-alanine N-acetyltransferase n=1 Tax=Gephyromycinifex aptenodytis TaxID=2716227 RepID=UPI001D0357B0|nr:ribosomal protein S18-alanine N-acetyltransferase [Gephyromycinifex aptenodytis]
MSQEALRLRSARLRELCWRDIEQLADLETELFGADAWSQATWWSELAGRPRRAYIVLESETEILGYAGLDLAGEVADVMTIAVAPAGQGFGYGRRLLGWLIETARAYGAAHLMLEVRADNDPAAGLYSSAGFTTISRRRRYYQPGDVDALIMRLPLEGHRS